MVVLDVEEVEEVVLDVEVDIEVVVLDVEEVAPFPATARKVLSTSISPLVVTTFLYWGFFWTLSSINFLTSTGERFGSIAITIAASPET